MIAHMTAHFNGGPLHGQARYGTCEKLHGHEIAVQEVLPLYAHYGYYEVEDDVISCEAFGELLVDITYEWNPWDHPEDEA